MIRYAPVTALAALMLLVPASRTHLAAFEIGGCAAVVGTDWHCGLPIHEQITEEAIRSVTPNADSTFLNNVNHGVQNTDLTHHFESQFHFDNSSAGNGAFDVGFSNVATLLQWAKQEATTCDPAGCRRNPRFLNPQHGTFTGIADDIVVTLRNVGGDPSCNAEPACPSAMLVATAAAIAAEVAPTRADASPDPDRTYSRLLGDVRYKVAESLGKHCDLSGQRCFDRLEDMLADRPSFQDKARHLRALQQELQAYYAWQHLGHAFHAVQDFFAHSNYVELAAGRKGPPCAPAVFKPDLCDAEITGLAPNALPLPAAASAVSDVSSFLDAFSANGVRRTLGARYDRLESGFYDTPQPVVCTPTAPLHYCHYSTNTAIGLNKDRPFDNGDANPSHKNHAYARTAAVRLSAQLWAAFLHDLPPENLVAMGRVHSASPVVRAPELTLEVVPGAVNATTRKATFTVNARDVVTRELKSGTVVVLGTNQMVQATGATGRPIAFVPCKEFDVELKRYAGSGSCTVRVTVTGYPMATTAVDWQ